MDFPQKDSVILLETLSTREQFRNVSQVAWRKTQKNKIRLFLPSRTGVLEG